MGTTVGALSLSQAEAFTEAKKQIADLLEGGLIEMYRGKAFSGDEDVVPRAQALAICSEKEQWSPPAADAEHCRILRKVEGVSGCFGY